MNIKHPKHEQTLVIIKPDGIARGLVGEVIRRYERAGLKLVAMKMMRATPDLIEKHYTLDPEWRRVTGEKTIMGYLDKGLKPPVEDPLQVTAILLGRLVKYMTAGPLVPMVWQGAHAVQIVRKLTGGTEPLMAAVGTIRGDFVIDSYKMTDDDDRSIRNVVHASGSVKEAQDEIAHWFKSNEILDYVTVHEKYLYDPEL
ncbi:MAG: nucleoside-diphosphate kinase [Patescibacteria group bacterium]|nr:nucleoside-diphosphate kinase [Patescibacteria group bacterium]